MSLTELLKQLIKYKIDDTNIPNLNFERRATTCINAINFWVIAWKTPAFCVYVVFRAIFYLSVVRADWK